jgi:exonuclease III
MIWVNKTTFPHRQIDIPSPDIAAVLIFSPSPTLIVSVYVPPEGGPNGVRSLTQVLEAIHHAYQRVRRDQTEDVNILIAGDFNRHDQLWGGDQVATHILQGGRTCFEIEIVPFVLAAILNMLYRSGCFISLHQMHMT